MSNATAEDPVCLVPARGTEPGLPKKNFKRVGGKPLLAHTVETARECEAVGEVHVTTESDALADVAADYGAVPIDRPARLADADTLLYEVVDHAIEWLREQGRPVDLDTPVVVLQPNVPFRRAEDVRAALETFERGHEAVVSVVERRGFFWRRTGEELDPVFEERTVSADLDPLYRETGSINVTTPAVVAGGTRVGESPGFVVTDRLSALSVDSVMDLWMAERVADGPRVVFRVDGSDELGMGHVYRCRTLAAELTASVPCQVMFVTDADRPAGARVLRETDHDVRASDDPMATIAGLDPDILFLDVLDTDAAAVRELHESAAAVVNLEDSGGGLEGADFVINALYDGEAGENHLAGPDYFVLREEFRDREHRLPDHAERVLCTFGGSDPRELSVVAARVGAADAGRQYRLVLGPEFDREDAVAALVGDSPNVTVLRDPEMGAQMAWADLAVASAGRTLYELAATGTPTLVIAQNDREAERARRLAETGVVEYLGHGDSVDPAEVERAVDRLAADPERRRALAERGQEFVDGAGTRRIVDVVFDFLTG